MLPERLREKMIGLTKDHDEAMGRQLLTDKQAGSLINLISEQAQHTLDIPNDIEKKRHAR